MRKGKRVKEMKTKIEVKGGREVAREETRSGKERNCESKENKRSGRSAKRDILENIEMYVRVKLHCLLIHLWKGYYSQTDTHIHLPPLLLLEKTTSVPFTPQMIQVFSIYH